MSNRSGPRTLTALFCLLVSFLVAGRAQAMQESPIRIACVGDSITEGNANPDHLVNSWPQILGRLLEQEFPGAYEVKNFGRSGATMLRTGSKPYWDDGLYPQSLEYLPEVVLINLGTNDATPRNWPEHGEAFEQDYRDLIGAYRELGTQPKVWLSNLTPIFEHFGSFEACNEFRPHVEATIAELAQELELGVVDFRSPLLDQALLFPDGLHPNTAGNELMAMAAFEAITGKPAPRDDSIRPRPVPGEPTPLIESGQGVDVRLGSWSQKAEWVAGTGAKQLLLSKVGVGAGDFHLLARVRMLDQENSAAGFVIAGNFFGFEGARGTLFRNGPQMGGGLRLLHPAPMIWNRGEWIDFEIIRNGEQVWFLINGFVAEMARMPGPIDRLGFDPTRSRMQIADWSLIGDVAPVVAEQMKRRTVATPWIDLSQRMDLRKPWNYQRGGGTPSGVYLYSPAQDQMVQLIGVMPNTARSRLRVSNDQGVTWADEFELPASLTGTNLQAAYLPDGRVMVVFQDSHDTSPTQGDVVAWIGSYEDLVEGREGQLVCRLYEQRVPNQKVTGVGFSVFEDGAIGIGMVFDNIVRANVNGQHQEVPERAILELTLSDLTKLAPTRGFDIPLIDLDADEGRHVVVDREAGQYLGHVSTEMLEDGKTILAVYPKGHGKGGIVRKRSVDAGLTWSERLPTPDNWSTSREVPTIHRVIDPKTGQKRLIMWSGLYPARLAVSEDDGANWSELNPVGDWGGIVVMGFVERLANGSYLAMFHDDGRFISETSQRQDPVVFTLYKTFSHDGGLTWTRPESVWSGSEIHLCEPGVVRSPDRRTLAVLLRENSRTRNSYVIFSQDEGQSWSAPRELPASLTGDRHTAAYGPDGRLFICFRDTAHVTPTQGDWVGWVGKWEDILLGHPGQYRVRLKDNKHGWDTTYPGVEALSDGTFVVTTYGHWDEEEEPYILSARFTLAELDERAKALPTKQALFERGQGGVNTYRIPALVTTQSGALIACCDARNQSGRDLPNNIDTVIRRSTDGGRTWGATETILDWDRTEGAADPALLVDRETGRIWCAVTWSDGVGWADSEPAYGKESFHNLLIHSDDDGKTWSEPVDITRELKHVSWRSAWFSPGVGLQSTSGRLLFPYSVADLDKNQFSYVAISDDHGETWRRVGPIGTKTNESMITELADGRLVCNMRSMHGLNQRAISVSEDDGETWSELVHDDELIEPACQASVLTVPAASTPDGREWMLFCNPASTQRERLTVRVSFDGGETWPVARLLHEGATAYSCMTLLPQGGVGVLYERGERHAYEGLTFAALPFEWLLEGQAR